MDISFRTKLFNSRGSDKKRRERGKEEKKRVKGGRKRIRSSYRTDKNRYLLHSRSLVE